MIDFISSHQTSSSLVAVSPYDPDSLVSMSSLSRLEEGAGIKIVSSLVEIPTQQLLSTARIFLEAVTEGASIEVIVRQWIESGYSLRPPTWRSLLAVLRELDLTDLSQQIEDYMHGT